MKSWNELRFWKSDTYDSICGFIQENDKYACGWDQHTRAFDLTPPDKVKVVILGQDPYPTKGHAHGLAFSVQPHVKPIPASLRNIFREYQDDLGYAQPSSGDLTTWAERGVLLLNTILTVEEGKPLSHANIGWEKLTYEVIKRLSDMPGRRVWIMWGRKAQEYTALVRNGDGENPVIESVHPSPLSARNGFFGTKPFSRANDLLRLGNCEQVDWKLP
jgi:uracil-DNA glycosylase